MKGKLKWKQFHFIAKVKSVSSLTRKTFIYKVKRHCLNYSHKPYSFTSASNKWPQVTVVNILSIPREHSNHKKRCFLHSHADFPLPIMHQLKIALSPPWHCQKQFTPPPFEFPGISPRVRTLAAGDFSCAVSGFESSFFRFRVFKLVLIVFSPPKSSAKQQEKNLWYPG